MATIPFSNVIATERFPIDAQAVVTGANVVILGARAGRAPDMLRNYVVTSEFPSFGDALTYMPLPLTYRWVAASPINAEACFELPEGFDPFLPPNDAGVPEPSTTTGFTNPGSPSAVRDGDPATYATGSSGDTKVIIYGPLASAIGFRAKYSCAVAGEAAIQINSNTVGAVATWATFTLPASNAPVELYALVPQDARNAWENDPDAGTPITPSPPYGALLGAPPWVRVSLTFPPGAANVFEFYPLVPNEVLLESVAQEQIRLPASEPRRGTVTGVVPPDVEHTITGWPGGDYTGRAAQHQYQLGRTVIDFEQAGALIGLRADSAEAVRERRVAIARAVQGSAYPVRMGERQ